MRSALFVAAIATLAAATPAAAQSGRTTNVRVEQGDPMKVRCTTRVEGMRGVRTRFECRLLRAGRLVGNHVQMATPGFDAAVWENDSYTIARGPVEAALGPGRHSVVAEFIITDPRSNRVIGHDRASFDMTVAGAATAPAAPRPAPAAARSSATVDQVTVQPDARNASEAIIDVSCRAQVRGARGQQVTVRCHVHSNGQPIPGGFATTTVTPNFDDTVFQKLTFALRRAFFEQRLGAGRHALEVVISVITPGDQVAGEGRAGFTMGADVRPTPTASRPQPQPRPQQPQPSASDGVPAAGADMFDVMAATVPRLRPHPRGRQDLRLDPALVGRWFNLTPYIDEALGLQYGRNARHDLRGYWTFYTVTLGADGGGHLTVTPCALVVSGAELGKVVPLDDVQVPLRAWGVEVHLTEERQPVTLLRLDFQDGRFDRGMALRVQGADGPRFDFTRFDEQRQAYDQERLMFIPDNPRGGEMLGEVLRRTQTSNAKLVDQMNALRITRRGMDMNMSFQMGMMLSNAAHESAMATIANMR